MTASLSRVGVARCACRVFMGAGGFESDSDPDGWCGLTLVELELGTENNVQ